MEYVSEAFTYNIIKVLDKVKITLGYLLKSSKIRPLDSRCLRPSSKMLIKTEVKLRQ